DFAQTRQWDKHAGVWQQETGCSEPIAELVRRLHDLDGIAPPRTPNAAGKDYFASAVRARFLFSCLVDADFLDTERHFDPEAAKQRAVASLHAERALPLLEAALAAKPSEGPVNQLRRQLLGDCLAVAAKPPGLFTLTAPTGS